MRFFSAFAALAAMGPGWTADASAQGARPGQQVSAEEYEGWRQYSVHCARCHGQDVLGNPVAANLLESTREGGPVAGRDAFVAVVQAGRPDRGMPAFADVISKEQSAAIHAYVKGRADGKIAAGRPARPRG
ncbi:MAG TPA: cytochrome c [Gemmatimonadales bacterium]|nr:cytochrome c [Gemmatimonadales bacterium]